MKTWNRNQNPRHELRPAERQTPSSSTPSLLHVNIAQIDIRARDIRVQSRLHSDGALGCSRRRLLVHRTGVLATVLVATEGTQLDKEHDNVDGERSFIRGP